VLAARKKDADMNKNINHPRFFMRDLQNVERKEHGMAKTPTKAQLPAMEMKEHGIKKKPTMSEIMKIERKEHVKGNKVVVGKGYMGRAKAK
jgi:pantothenate synthetase